MNSIQLRLEEWLQAILLTENPSKEIVAFRFGLSEDEDGYLVYLAGSEKHDEADDEWASYPPDFLAKKEAHVADDEVTDWSELLELMMDFLNTTLKTSQAAASFLGGSTPVHTGFVDGDLHRIK